MSILQKPLQAYIFVDYVPAELRENKRWEIVYYVKNPFSKKLVRKVNRVRPLKSIIQRRKLGRQMVKNINNKLASGWNPFKNETTASAFNNFIAELDRFIKRKRKELIKNDLRPETIKSYSSYANVIKRYLVNNNQEQMTIYDADALFVDDFLDYIYYDCENSARTRNNYLSFFNTLFNFFKSKKYVGANPCMDIKYSQKIVVSKIIMPKEIRKRIATHFNNENYNYFTLCLSCYYCLIRRTEMTKLRVGDVIINKSIIYISSEQSKNKKTKPVTIPSIFLNRMTNHIKNANQNDYLFSSDNYKPGPLQLNPKKISNEWNKMRKTIKINFAWYSLKDTGITDLLMQGVPTIKVRDQARHYSIQQTEEYTPKQILNAVSDIQYNNNSF